MSVDPSFLHRNTMLAYSLLSRGNKLSANSVRRITIRDVPRIMLLRNEITEKMFDEEEIYDIVYSCSVAFGIEDGGELIGAACFDDYPGIKSVPMWSWELWLDNLFGIKRLSALNSKWIRLLAFDLRYLTRFLAPILEVLFAENRRLEYVAFAIPPGIRIITFLTEFVTRVLPKGYIHPMAVTTLGLLVRRDFQNEYKIRKAVEEDNDDVVAIIDRCSSRLKKCYGEYYISELIRCMSTHRQVIVAESESAVVATMIVNEKVNIDMLTESFETWPFHGFKEPHEDDDYNMPESVLPTSFAPEESLYEIMSFDKMVPLSTSSTLSSIHDSSDILSIKTFQSASETSSEDSWTLDPSLDLSTLVMRKDDDFFDLSGYFKIASEASLLSTCMLNTDERIRSSMVQTKANKTSSVELRPTKQVAELLRRLVPIPTFCGAQNAFVVEILIADPGHEQAMESLVVSSFQCFRNKEYCLICAPSDEAPFEILKDFVRAIPRNHSTFPQDLFVFHRNAVDGDMNVRITTLDDNPHVLEFLDLMMNPMGLFDQYSSSVRDENSSFMTLILTCGRQIIGLAVLKEHVNLDYLSSHYCLYKWIDESRHKNENVGVLENLIINPVFHGYCQFFLNQIHRLADFSILLYFVTCDDLDDATRYRPILNCLQFLVPIRARRLPEYDKNFIEEACCPPEYITYLPSNFSLFISMVKLMGIKRKEINARIVVIGTGNTAMAFLETLVFGSSADLLVTFNNITVVSPHGLPLYKENPRSKSLLHMRRNYSFYQRLSNMDMRIHVNTIHGVLNKIKRKKKIIIINEITHLPYDYLVLFCGEQYILPKFKNKSKRKLADFPENAFVINTDSDVIQVFNKMLRYRKDLSEKRLVVDDLIIVYGRDIRALSCLSTLLEHGVPSQLLAYVKPSNVQRFGRLNPDPSNLIFPDPEIGEAIDRIIINLGIATYKGYIISNWEMNDENWITNVEFKAKGTTLNLGCKFIFIYGDKSISNKTFQALIKAGLVFDGRLIIDSKFCTNDPNIFAAGPLTKYSQKYFAPHKSHIYYDPQEVGETIGKQFREMLIPEESKKDGFVVKDLPDGIEKLNDPLPEFEKPIVVHCALPGEVFYLSVTPPGQRIPAELTIGSENYGQLLVTGDYEHLERQGYFRLHINTMERVQSICCLSREPLDLTNLVSIYGKHVTVLNELLVRFEMSTINDLFDFFKQPSLTAVYYDKFSELMQEIRTILLNTKTEDDGTIPNKVLEMYEDNRWSLLTEQQNFEINYLLRNTTIVNEIEDKVLDYIQKHRLHLPMYAYPSLVQQILQRHEKSPMFTK